MPSYKLVYFNIRGRAEPTRMMLNYVGQKFEDVRYSSEEWVKHKPTTPFQQLPYLEVDGKIIPQSRVIEGFVAREFGLNGASNEETTTIDLVTAVLKDIMDPLGKIFYEKDEVKKKELSATYYGETAPRFLKGLEDILKTNNGGDGFFVGSKISRADIVFYVSMELSLKDDVLKEYPKLYSLKERVAKDPKIAAYLKNPVSCRFTLVPTMPSYKLVYFNSRGRAETTRLILAHVGQKFEDVRYSYEEWARHKADAPFQQLPYLEVDGKRLPQSRAIHGFLAREFGLNGANNEETTKIDIIIATVEDLTAPVVKIFFEEKDEAKKKALFATYLEETAPRFLSPLEEMLKKNNGGDGYFVGSKLSRADIVFFSSVEFFKEEYGVFKKYPKLTALKGRVAKDPKIAAYLAKRPKTEF
ncbi:glutathione S-transferase 1-like [Acanthaster planci]|uniref:glutathione transferase n=1 Tax=Acanthaster planci TaxID=133434 RepID=A0A8B7XM77_ACAPL|nr:glutathione S-transferase 1-like [Acanthaster planci]